MDSDVGGVGETRKPSEERKASNGPQPAPGCANPTGVLVSAGSAGGLAAIGVVLSSLPADFPLPIVVVQHRSPIEPQMLPRILARSTPLRVKLGEHGERLQTGTIYVAPAAFHVLIQPDATIRLFDGRRIKFLRSSANPLFESAARAFGAGVIAVVLSGYGSDATDGVQAVKQAGGIVIAQDAVTAQTFGMPGAAIASGSVDYVLPIEEIAPTVVRLARRSQPSGCGDDSWPAVADDVARMLPRTHDTPLLSAGEPATFGAASSGYRLEERPGTDKETL